MQIDINQKKIALGSKYEIVRNGKTIYKAASKLFRFLSEINLFRPEDDHVLLSIHRLFSFFTAKYSLEMDNGSEALFYTVKYWKNHYRCEYRGKGYDIYGHRKRKFSIFKNDNQIARFEKEAVSYFEGDNYKLTADDDVEVILLLGFVLVIDNYRNRSRNRGIINYDFGSVFEARPFDENWIPAENIDKTVIRN